MNSILTQMISKYNTTSLTDKRNVLKEVVQEIALCGLARTDFFKEAAFYGGTALRIFHSLDRFSEDLDFSLKEPNTNFDLSKYFYSIEKELSYLGLNFSVKEKEKTSDSNIKSAFLKGNTKEHILNIYGDIQNTIHPNEIITIKFELDVNPPKDANFERKFGLLPSPYEVCLYDLPSLFAGKIHAVLCRSWKNRIKGRDLYDYIFYISRNIKVNLSHLKARLVDSNAIDKDFDLNRDSLINLLNTRFLNIDYELAKKDVLPYINENYPLNLWRAEFFIEITKNLNI